MAPPPLLQPCSSLTAASPHSALRLLMAFLLLIPHSPSPLQALLVLLINTHGAGAGAEPPSDTDALTIFRLATDTHRILASNWTTPDACSGRWRGVACSRLSGRVTSLSLPSLDLRGPLDPISHLHQLRALDLRANRLTGNLPLLLPLNLHLLYLSRNDLSGPIAPLARLRRLVRLDLSDNSLTGPIPAALANLTALLTLRLQDNLLSGGLPDVAAALPNLRDLNVSNNQLSGRVPDAVRSKFGDASYAGNAGLCALCSTVDVSPPAAAAHGTPTHPPSAPSSAGDININKGGGDDDRGARKLPMSPGTVAGIAVGGAVLLLVLASLLLPHCCCGNNGPPTTSTSTEKVDEDEAAGRGLDNNNNNNNNNNNLTRRNGNKGDGYGGTDPQEEEAEAAGGDSSSSRLVFFERNGRRWFDLEELLRASAEMVGKGSLGTVYRAVLEDGCVVAVKRLKDANPCARKVFDRYMQVVGRLRHPNLVRLRAYYYARQEKLLIYDYLPNGTLFSLLHGSRGRPGRTPLDWTTRMSLLTGAARGLARIHQQYGSSSSARIPHGNIKSSNILLDKDGCALVSDFGLALLLSPAHATKTLGAGYRAPEQSDTLSLSQEADVYAFGVLLLEVLTGRAPSQYHHHPGPAAAPPPGINLPDWVRSVVREEWTAEVFDAELLRYKDIEEEMVGMLHVAMGCVAPRPDDRPRMADVVKMIEGIGGVAELSPLVDHGADARRASSSSSSSSPPSILTTDDARFSCGG